MIGLETVQFPDRFTMYMDTWRDGNLIVSLNNGYCEHLYEDIARENLLANYQFGNFDDRSELVYGHGYSVAEAVANLNRTLALMGIEEYSLEGLPTNHDTHFEYHYLRVWQAHHLCKGEDLEKKRQYVANFTYRAESEYGVQHDMLTLFRTQLVKPWEAPEKGQFPITRTRRHEAPAMWVSEAFYPYGSPSFFGGGDITIVRPKLKMGLPDPIYGRRSHYTQEEDQLVVIHLNDLIITGESLVYVRLDGENLMVPTQRITEIHEDHAVTNLRWIRAAILPEPIKNKAQKRAPRVTI